VLSLIFPVLVSLGADLPLVDPGRAPVLTMASGRLRASGVPIVAVEQAGSAAAVVQLHVRTGTSERTLDEARATWVFAAALADGRQKLPRDVSASDDVREARGETRVAVDIDGFVVSDAVPAAAIDTALRAVEKRLARRKKLVVPATFPPRLAEAKGEIPHPARQLIAAGHTASFPLDEEANPSPALFALLVDKTLRKDDVVLVVVGPEAPDKLIARAERAVRTPLPAGRGSATPLPPITGTRTIEGAEIPLDDAVFGAEVVAVYVPLARASSSEGPEDPVAQRRTRAAEHVLAELSGIALEERASFSVLSVVVRHPVDARAFPEGVEKAAREPLAAIARAPVDDGVLDMARRRTRARLLRKLSTPEGTALVVGRAALKDGDAREAVALVDAVGAVTADALVDVAARALATGCVVASGTEVAPWR